MRTFIAIDLAPEIKNALLDFLRRLRKQGSPNIGWIKEHGMHITLKFLGEIDDAQAAHIKDIMSEVAGSSKAFSLKIKGTGFFPPHGRLPRVLWVGTAEQPALYDIQSRLESRLEKLGFSRESRPFHPHLTLGRVRAPSGLREVIAELEKNKEAEFGEMMVEGIILYKSTLKPSGAEYSILSECRFS